MTTRGLALPRMYLTQTAEYVLRAMAQLAFVEENGVMSVADLAEATTIPRAYLSKIMRRMVVANLVTARKGHGGGFSLAKPAQEIRFADVLTAAGFQPMDSHCAFGWGKCNAARPCALHFAYTELTQRCGGWASDFTLADVRKFEYSVGNTRPDQPVTPTSKNDSLKKIPKRKTQKGKTQKENQAETPKDATDK